MSEAKFDLIFIWKFKRFPFHLNHLLAKWKPILCFFFFLQWHFKLSIFSSGFYFSYIFTLFCIGSSIYKSITIILIHWDFFDLTIQLHLFYVLNLSGIFFIGSHQRHSIDFDVKIFHGFAQIIVDCCLLNSRWEIDGRWGIFWWCCAASGTWFIIIRGVWQCCWKMMRFWSIRWVKIWKLNMHWHTIGQHLRKEKNIMFGQFHWFKIAVQHLIAWHYRSLKYQAIV